MRRTDAPFIRTVWACRHSRALRRMPTNGVIITAGRSGPVCVCVCVCGGVCLSESPMHSEKSANTSHTEAGSHPRQEYLEIMILYHPKSLSFFFFWSCTTPSLSLFFFLVYQPFPRMPVSTGKCLAYTNMHHKCPLC